MYKETTYAQKLKKTVNSTCPAQTENFLKSPQLSCAKKITPYVPMLI